jgi:hypothetical protein
VPPSATKPQTGRAAKRAAMPLGQPAAEPPSRTATERRAANDPPSRRPGDPQSHRGRARRRAHRVPRDAPIRVASSLRSTLGSGHATFLTRLRITRCKCAGYFFARLRVTRPGWPGWYNSRLRTARPQGPDPHEQSLFATESIVGKSSRACSDILFTRNMLEPLFQ